ncbi:hypothetical protein BGZ80_006641 [Entomortierella chlamydospora]|uniref:AD domain-containing protein n=1 Tax=Entomortierella chlamydospora TaxID=101097 RepID=A0A9P6MZV3_9FUNG|nr:hypothetical protein BGZ80_006641 [Entomortierella chlamydospora]
MESLNKKTPISFAAAAGKISLAQPASASPPPTTTTTTASTSTGGTTSGSGQPPTKNGANVPGNQSSSSQGSQSLSSSVPTSGTGAIKSTASASSGSIDWIVGLNVKVITQADDVFEGQVYAYDVIMNCICQSKITSTATTPATYYSQSLGGNCSAPRPKYDFRILKINYIKEVVPLSTTAASNVKETELSEEGKTNAGANNSNSITSNVYSTALPVVGYVQLDKIQQREQQAVREVQAAAARIGVGVTSIAQDIFDALSKTYV